MAFCCQHRSAAASWPPPHFFRSSSLRCSVVGTLLSNSLGILLLFPRIKFGNTWKGDARPAGRQRASERLSDLEERVGLSGVVAMGGLGWDSWIANVLWVATDTLFQRVTSMHVPGLPPLTPLPHLTCIITGCTSGIGLQTAKYRSPIAGITSLLLLLF